MLKIDHLNIEFKLKIFCIFIFKFITYYKILKNIAKISKNVNYLPFRVNYSRKLHKLQTVDNQSNKIEERGVQIEKFYI